MKPTVEWEKEAWDEDLDKDSHRHCRKIVDMFRWLVEERPDIMFDVKNVLENLQSRKYRLWQHVKWVVRYLAGTRDYVQKIEVNSEVILGKSVDQHSLVGWSDADFAGDVELGGALLAQCSDWMAQTFTHIHAKRLASSRHAKRYSLGSSNCCASSNALCRPRLNNIGMRGSPCCAMLCRTPSASSHTYELGCAYAVVANGSKLRRGGTSSSFDMETCICVKKCETVVGCGVSCLQNDMKKNVSASDTRGEEAFVQAQKILICSKGAKNRRIKTLLYFLLRNPPT